MTSQSGKSASEVSAAPAPVPSKTKKSISPAPYFGNGANSSSSTDDETKAGNLRTEDFVNSLADVERLREKFPPTDTPGVLVNDRLDSLERLLQEPWVFQRCPVGWEIGHESSPSIIRTSQIKGFNYLQFIIRRSPKSYSPLEVANEFGVSGTDIEEFESSGLTGRTSIDGQLNLPRGDQMVGWVKENLEENLQAQQEAQSVEDLEELKERQRETAGNRTRNNWRTGYFTGFPGRIRSFEGQRAG